MMEEREWPVIEALIPEKMRELTQATDRIPDLVDKAAKAVLKLKEEKLKQDSRKRSQDTKEAKHFKARGCVNCLANLGSRMLTFRSEHEGDCLQANAEPPFVLNVWHNYGKKAHISSVVSKFEAKLATETNSLFEKLATPENRTCRGLYHHLGGCDGVADAEAIINEDPELKNSKPHSLVIFQPFAVAIRGHTMRHGNLAVPFTAQGLWIVGARGELVMTTVDLAFLSEKCNLSSLDGVEKALAERAAIRQKGDTMIVNPGECVYVPWGLVPFITSTSDVAAYYVVPWLSKAATGDPDAAVQELVYAGFTKFLKDMGSKVPWGAISKEWKKFRATLE